MLQVLNGDGFVYIGDLPTELLEEPSTSGQASTSGQQSSTPMLPVNGRDALMHDASADLSEALTKAYKAGCVCHQPFSSTGAKILARSPLHSAFGPSL